MKIFPWLPVTVINEDAAASMALEEGLVGVAYINMNEALMLNGIKQSSDYGALQIEEDAALSKEPTFYERDYEHSAVTNTYLARHISFQDFIIREEGPNNLEETSEPHSRSCQLEQPQEVTTENKGKNPPCPTIGSTKTWIVELGDLSTQNFLALGVPWKLYTAAAALTHTNSRGRLRTLNNTCTELNMPDMIYHNSPSSSGQGCSGARTSGSLTSQPFTLTSPKKVEIPSTFSLNNNHAAQHAMRSAEPSDLGIPYLSTGAEPKESNVLRKVANPTYEMSMDQRQTSSPARTRGSLERQVGSVENFEGQMLVSNLLSSIEEDHYLRLPVAYNDLRLIRIFFVNYSLGIGIICPLEDASGEARFMTDRVYKWNRQESNPAGNVNGSPARSKTEYLTNQEYLVALQSARQEHSSMLKSRPTPEVPPYVPPPSPYASVQSSGMSSPPSPPPMMGDSISPPPMMGGPPPPSPPMMGELPPPPPPGPGGPPLFTSLIIHS